MDSMDSESKFKNTYWITLLIKHLSKQYFRKMYVFFLYMHIKNPKEKIDCQLTFRPFHLLPIFLLIHCSNSSMVIVKPNSTFRGDIASNELK